MARESATRRSACAARACGSAFSFLSRMRRASAGANASYRPRRPTSAQEVQHHADHLGLGVAFVRQPLHLVPEDSSGALRGDRHVPPRPIRVEEHERVAGALGAVLVVAASRLTGFNRKWGAHFSQQLLVAFFQVHPRIQDWWTARDPEAERYTRSAMEPTAVEPDTEKSWDGDAKNVPCGSERLGPAGRTRDKLNHGPRSGLLKAQPGVWPRPWGNGPADKCQPVPIRLR